METARDLAPTDQARRHRRAFSLAAPLLVSLSLVAASCSSTSSASSGAASSPRPAHPKAAKSTAPRATSGAPVSRVAGARQGATAGERQFCSALASATKGYSGAPATRTRSSVQAAFGQLKQEEPKVLAAAPGPVRASFRELFSVVNHFYDAVASVGYSYAKLPVATARSLAEASARLAAPTRTIQAYVAKTCSVTAGGGTSALTG